MLIEKKEEKKTVPRSQTFNGRLQLKGIPIDNGKLPI